jgi:osmoprotectant transport system permease protein
MPLKIRIFIISFVIMLILTILATTHKYTPKDTIKAAFDAEFLTRPDGYPGLKKHYGFEFSSHPRQMDPGLMYKAIENGSVDVIDAFATDGRIPAYNLVILQDNKEFFPPYYAAPLARKSTLDKYPEIKDTLNLLAGKISDKQMQQLNYRVDEKGEKAKKVAKDFLVSLGLISSAEKATKGTKGTVIVGGKHFTEQEILGEMLCLLLEYKTAIKVIRRLNLGGTIICFNAIKSGDIDIYSEYTGTGLVNILKEKVISDPEKAYQKVKEAFLTKYNLVWLKPYGFNNTYTLTMRKQQANKLNITTISDLAEYIKQQE